LKSLALSENSRAILEVFCFTVCG